MATDRRVSTIGLYSRLLYAAAFAAIVCGSGGELPGSLGKIAGPDPELFEPAQRHTHALQIDVGDLGLAQHLDVAPVHDAEPVA